MINENLQKIDVWLGFEWPAKKWMLDWDLNGRLTSRERRHWRREGFGWMAGDGWPVAFPSSSTRSLPFLPATTRFPVWIFLTPNSLFPVVVWKAWLSIFPVVVCRRCSQQWRSVFWQVDHYSHLRMLRLARVWGRASELFFKILSE